MDLAGREDLVGRFAELAEDVEASAPVLVTRHVTEIPPALTDVLLLGDGDVVAAGPLEHELTAATLSAAFGLVAGSSGLRRGRGRLWAARVM